MAATKRGKKATPKQQTEILNLAEQLEKKNPTSDPALSPLISGRWSLLYIGKPCGQSPHLYCGGSSAEHHIVSASFLPGRICDCFMSAQRIHQQQHGLLFAGPGQSGDVDWQQRTGGIEGPFLAFFQSLTRNAVKNRVRVYWYDRLQHSEHKILL